MAIAGGVGLTREKLATTALLFLGFALCKTLTLDSYVTAFGAVKDPLAYVSNVPFMLAASAGIVLTSVAMLLWRSRDHRPFVLPYRLPLLVLVLACALGCLPAPPPVGAMMVVGVLWGCATTLVTTSFIELLACENSPLVVILQLALALVLPAALTVVLRIAPEAVRLLAYGVFAAVGWLAVRCGRRVLEPHVPDEPADHSSLRRSPHSRFARAMRDSSLPVMAAVFFEFVIGLINMFAYFGGSSFSIASSAPIWGMLVCAALLVAFVAVTNRTPGLEVMSIVVFPLVIAVFLLFPFLGDAFGPQLSVVIYTAYTFTSTLATFCYIRACWQNGADPYCVASLVRLLTRLMLLLGFALGYGCAQLPNSEPLVKTGVVVAVCVYMLLFVTVVWYFKSARKVSGGSVQKVVQSFEEANSARMDEFVETYGLTGRERDVYSALLKGGTAKSIASELGLSPYTVQGYVQGLYAKLEVNKKEQAVELFYTGSHPASRSRDAE